MLLHSTLDGIYAYYESLEKSLGKFAQYNFQLNITRIFL
jgi:hypothetical protein